MKVIIFMFAATVLVATDAYVYMEEGPCVDPVSGEPFSVGSVIFPEGHCEELSCREEDGVTYVVTMGCSVSSPPEDCTNVHIVQHLHRQYPDCCVLYECHDHVQGGQK